MKTMRRGRPLLRTLSDLMVLVALLAMVVAAARQAGWLGKPEDASGGFTVTDGDSLRKAEAEYRLFGIDAPEMKQSCMASTGRSYPCGEEARNSLRTLAAGKKLDCSVSGADRYGRLLAVCRGGALDINAEMVRLGWAVAYLHANYAPQERDAKRSRRGLWQGDFQRPEAWRAERRRKLIQSGMADNEPPD